MAKHLVAARQKIIGIDLLEVIDVDVAERQRAGIAGMALQLEASQFLHRATIEKARQWVGKGQSFQFRRPLLQQVIRILQLMGPVRDARFQVAIELTQLL